MGTVVSRLSSELLEYEGMHPPPLTPEGMAADMSDYDLKKHVDDLVDHVAALKEQTSSMVRACVRKGVVGGIGLVCVRVCVCGLIRTRTEPTRHHSTQIDWAKSLNDEFLNNEQSRMNEVMYLLTMTTVVLLPAQFLTGVFGAWRE